MSVKNIFSNVKSAKDFEISTHISIKNKYVFVQVSKSGSSNVKSFLQKEEFKDSPWGVSNVNNKWYSPHLSPYQFRASELDDIFFGKDYKITSFVRNPFTRLLSCYLHRIVGEPSSPSNIYLKKINNGKGGGDVSFDEFVEIVCSQSSIEQESHWRCQSDDLGFDKIRYDFIGRLESFDSDIGKMLSLLFTNQELREPALSAQADMSPMKTNSTEKVKLYYKDPITVKSVLDRYESDFINFGYTEVI